MKTLRERLGDLLLYKNAISDGTIGRIMETVEDQIDNLDHYTIDEMQYDTNVQWVKREDIDKMLAEKMPPEVKP